MTTNLLVWAVLNRICQPDVEQSRPDWQNKQSAEANLNEK